jgi:hypothetical protein
MGVELKVVSPSDLVLLKLYAAGARDLRDVEDLLGRADRAEIVREVDARIGELPAEARTAWRRCLERVVAP